MNLFQLVIKQMRQRSLSTWLTLLSVMLGVSLAIAIMILRREAHNLFVQTDFGYDILLGPPKGSPLQLTLNTVYHMDQSPGVISYQVFEDMKRRTPLPGRPAYAPDVRIAIPFSVGDSFNGRRIIGTSPQMFGYDDAGQKMAQPFQYRKDKAYEFAQGRAFGPRKFEAVVGSEIAETFHLKLFDDKLSEEENEKRGGAIRVTHGMPGPTEKPDIHKPRWRIVGILKPTQTANDRVAFIPFISLYAIAEHETGIIDQALARAGINPADVPPDKLDETLRGLGFDPEKIPESVKKKFRLRAATATSPATAAAEEDEDAYHLDEQGNIIPDLPQKEWELSAILVRSRSPFAAQRLLDYQFKVIDDRASAVSPAIVMREFFDTFLAGSTRILLLISAFVTVVAAASIMTTIYNSVTARRREIAILRALGATRWRILALICLEAGLVGFFGGLIGLVTGHLLSAGGSFYLRRILGEGINWLVVGPEEWGYLGAVVAIALLAGLVPGLKAYKTPVATNLMAG